MHNRQTTLLLVSSILHFLFLPTFISAQLSCQSPTSLPADTLQAGTPLTLKFTNKPTSLGSALLSDVSANLICSSTGDSVLTLATKLGSGKTTSVTLSPAQVSSALKACPANNFNVQYEEDTLLSKNTENCQGSFSIEPPATTKQPQLDANTNKDALIGLPSLTIPLLIPDAPTTATPTATGSPSTTSTMVEPQPKTTTTVPPIVPTTTTTTIVTTTGVPPVVVPPNHSSATTPAPGTTNAPPKNPHPPAPTTTTRPPKSGGGKGDGGNDKNNTPSPSPPSPSPSNDLASSDLQQSTGSGPSTVTIAGISVGILAGVFVILGAMLVWRKRAQRRANFDLFYGDTLAAASGFQPSGSSSSPSSSAAAEQPIYGRSAPEDEKYDMNGGVVVVGGAALNRKVSSNAPRRSRSHTSNHTNKSPHMQSSAPQPPLLMPMHPLPTAVGAGQDASYYHQQHQQDSYYANQQYQQQQDYYASQHQHHQQQQQQQPPKRKPSYRLPRHHPGFDYEYEQSVGQR